MSVNFVIIIIVRYKQQWSVCCECRVGETCDDTLQDNLQNSAVQSQNPDVSETNHVLAQSSRSLVSNGTLPSSNESTNRTVFSSTSV